MCMYCLHGLEAFSETKFHLLLSILNFDLQNCISLSFYPLIIICLFFIYFLKHLFTPHESDNPLY